MMRGVCNVVSAPLLNAISRLSKKNSANKDYHRRFLRLLLRKIPGKLLVIWDGASIHRAKVIKAFLAAGAARRLHLERLPGYAPDLNPQEGVWNLLKRRGLKKVCYQNLSDVREALVRAKERLRHRREILQSCFLHALGAL